MLSFNKAPTTPHGVNSCQKQNHDHSNNTATDRPPLCQYLQDGLKLLPLLSMANYSLFQLSPEDILIACVKIKASLTARENSIIDISAQGKLALTGQWLFQQKINVSTAWWQGGWNVGGNTLFQFGLYGPLHVSL